MFTWRTVSTCLHFFLSPQAHPSPLSEAVAGMAAMVWAIPLPCEEVPNGFRDGSSSFKAARHLLEWDTLGRRGTLGARIGGGPGGS